MSGVLDQVPTLSGDEVDSKDSSLDKDGLRQRNRTGIQFVSSISKDEPVVTRRELWSYYCTLASISCCIVILTISIVYYNGDNVGVSYRVNSTPADISSLGRRS